jgi:hypothetical protein
MGCENASQMSLQFCSSLTDEAVAAQALEQSTSLTFSVNRNFATEIFALCEGRISLIAVFS